MPRITISYRRDDSGVITGRIFDRLAAHYGREAVFRDIDDIPPGVDFRRHISGILDDSDIVLAIVGPRWIGPRAGQSRLANAADPVRVEIETALRKDRPLIPVLVLRGSMPRVEQLPESMEDFAYRHAVSIDAGQDFDVHMARLIRAMDRSLEGIAQRAERADVEGLTDAIDAMPPEPAPITDRDWSPEPSPSDEIEALRQANRELEERLATLTAAREKEARTAAKLRDEAKRLTEQATATTFKIGLLQAALDEAEVKIKDREAEIAKLGERLGARALDPGPSGTGWRPGLVILAATTAGLISVVVTAAVVKTIAEREATALRDQLVATQRSNNNLQTPLPSAAQPSQIPPASPSPRSPQEAYQQGLDAAYGHYYVDAVRLFRLAANQGHAAAQYNLGWLYENGLGTVKDVGEARRWYKLAADQGFEGAKKALVRLGSR